MAAEHLSPSPSPERCVGFDVDNGVTQSRPRSTSRRSGSVTTSVNRASSAASARTSIRRRRQNENACGAHIDSLGAVAFAAAFKLDSDFRTQVPPSPPRHGGDGSPTGGGLVSTPVKGALHLSVHRASRGHVPDPVMDTNRAREQQRRSSRPTDSVANRALAALKECDDAAFTAIPSHLTRGGVRKRPT